MVLFWVGFLFQLCELLQTLHPTHLVCGWLIFSVTRAALPLAVSACSNANTDVFSNASVVVTLPICQTRLCKDLGCSFPGPSSFMFCENRSVPTYLAQSILTFCRPKAHPAWPLQSGNWQHSILVGPFSRVTTGNIPRWFSHSLYST